MIQPFDAEVAGRANEKLPGNLGNGYLSGANFQPLLVKTNFASLLPVPGYQRDFPLPFPRGCTYKYTHYCKIGPFP